MISKGLESFLNYLRETEQLSRFAFADEQQANDETQDILHSLELEEHNYHSTAHLAERLKEVRKKRRAAKDMIAQTAPIIEWIEHNKSVIKTLEQVLGRVRKEEKNADGRIYTPKTNIADMSKESKRKANS